MGYTHYFRQTRHPTPAEWDQLVTAFKQMQTVALLDEPLQITGNEDMPEPPRMDSDWIIFNGLGDDAHETMVVYRMGAGFQCCKTAQKPYDRAVVALLCLMHTLLPGTWEIGSDGDPDDWDEGLALAREVCPQATCPIV